MKSELERHFRIIRNCVTLTEEEHSASSSKTSEDFFFVLDNGIMVQFFEYGNNSLYLLSIYYSQAFDKYNLT